MSLNWQGGRRGERQRARPLPKRVLRADTLTARASRAGEWSGRLIVLAATLFLGGCAAMVTPNFSADLTELRSGDYTLDPEHAYLLFRVEHLGLSMVIGRFNTVDATLDFDPDDLASLRLDGVVDVASIDLGNADLEGRLRGSDWLDTTSFPEARFTTTSVQAREAGAFTVIGDFTLRGVTLPLTLEARFNGGADNLLTGRYTLGFTASGSLSRQAYGVDALGALVGDEIGIEIHAEFQRSR